MAGLHWAETTITCGGFFAHTHPESEMYVSRKIPLIDVRHRPVFPYSVDWVLCAEGGKTMLDHLVRYTCIFKS